MGSEMCIRDSPSGHLVRSPERDTHQHLRACCSVPCCEKVASSSKVSCESAFRQCHSSSMLKPSGFNQVSPSECLDSNHSSDDEEEGGGSIRIPHTRYEEHLSGCIVQTDSNGHGVDVGQGFISSSLPRDVCSPGGLVRHSGEQSSERLCLPSIGFSSNRHRRVCPQLESVELNLSLSSNEINFEGFESPGELQGESPPRNTDVALPAVVPSSPIEGQAMYEMVLEEKLLCPRRIRAGE